MCGEITTLGSEAVPNYDSVAEFDAAASAHPGPVSGVTPRCRHRLHGPNLTVHRSTDTALDMRSRSAAGWGLVLAAAWSLGTPHSAAGQLATAELYVNVTAGATASDMNVPSDTQSFRDGPRTADVLLQSGTISWGLQAIAGGGEADTDGQIHYLTGASQIAISGTFAFHAAATAPAASMAGFDSGVKVTFQTTNTTPYSLSGHVQTGRDLSDSEVVACQINGRSLAGDTRATPLTAGQYTFVDSGTFSPQESIFVECAAASSGGTSDGNHSEWELTLNFGDTGTTTTTLVAPTKRQCRRACVQAVKTCRAACDGTKAERRACRHDCKRRGRGCGLTTGCTLAAS